VKRNTRNIHWLALVLLIVLPLAWHDGMPDPPCTIQKSSLDIVRSLQPFDVPMRMTLLGSGFSGGLPAVQERPVRPQRNCPIRLASADRLVRAAADPSPPLAWVSGFHARFDPSYAALLSVRLDFLSPATLRS
jgi:hypothetical protein